MNIETCTVLTLNILSTKVEPRIFNVSNREGHSLSFRLSGSNTIKANGKEYISDYETLTFVPNGANYKHIINEASHQIVARFTTKENIGSNIEVLELSEELKLKELFKSLLKYQEQTQKSNSIKCMTTFYRILSIIEEEQSKNVYHDNMFEETLTHLYSSYRDSNFLVSELHAMAHISETYYRRIFKHRFGCSPVAYLKSLRINYAKQLIKNGYHNVSEIAFLCGFNSPAYFCHEFKRLTGKPPGEYF